jgi:tetratricopeptide (TPR) repeat protein
MRKSVLALALALALGVARSAHAQIPDKFENLKHFPKDIAKDSLVQVMRGFSFALGVRCQYCHAGGDGVSFVGVKFDSDDKPTKRKARYMLDMVDKINGQLLTGIEPKADPPVNVRCVTCHRGSPLPKTLEQVLMETVKKDGIPAALTRYRDLRQNTLELGKYDFGEWSINETARKLTVAGDTAAAIALFELNLEFNPKSTSIDAFLGDLYEKRGEKDKALSHFEKAVVQQPNNPELKRRLAGLKGG